MKFTYSSLSNLIKGQFYVADQSKVELNVQPFETDTLSDTFYQVFYRYNLEVFGVDQIDEDEARERLSFSGTAQVFNLATARIHAEFGLDDTQEPTFLITVFLEQTLGAKPWTFGSSFPQLANTVFEEVEVLNQIQLAELNMPNIHPVLLVSSYDYTDDTRANVAVKSGLNFCGFVNLNKPPFEQFRWIYPNIPTVPACGTLSFTSPTAVQNQVENETTPDEDPDDETIDPSAQVNHPAILIKVFETSFGLFNHFLSFQRRLSYKTSHQIFTATFH